MHEANPAVLSEFKSVKLSSLQTVHFRFQHILHMYEGEPYTKCISAEGNKDYNEASCLEVNLFIKLCTTCDCYPSYSKVVS